MRIVTGRAEMASIPGHGSGLVPTMGALHQGHLALIQRAKEENERVTVSIFVNPTQFAPHEDFTRYPRPFEQDVEAAGSAGADLIFAPSVEEMYPRKTTVIRVLEVSDRWEGETRPTHFEGVATVVGKLLHLTRPDSVYFGQKDFQQCAVIRRMIEDLHWPVRLVVCPTIREPDGLAMSSRNRYLSAHERQTAPLIYRVLQDVRRDLLAGVPPSQAAHMGRKELEDNGLRVDYLTLVDEETLVPVEKISKKVAILVAARIGNVRLLDNLIVDGSPELSGS